MEHEHDSAAPTQRLDLLIPVVNKLQVAFASARLEMIKLPQIVVVGDQNAGKSSVLDSLVGEEILPRGHGLVTRCPVVMQMVHVESISEKRCELKGEIITDFSQIGDKLKAEMAVLAGPDKNIVSEPIILTIPFVVPLTVVDLPGIVKVPREDQRKNLADEIERLIMKYIDTPDAIILAISEATHDLQAAESMRLARQVDPNGDRTIVVLTKLDLMGRGATAEAVLLGNVIPVKLGIIGVINRSQEDIDKKMSVQDALQQEKQYLEEKYPGLASKNGTPYLARQLNSTLMNHIKKCLPLVEERIKAEMQNCNKKDRDLGPELNDHQKSEKLLDLIEKFCSEYKATISGCWRDSDEGGRLGGAAIRRRCREILTKYFGGGFTPGNMPSDSDVTLAVWSSPGFEAIMSPQGAFVEFTKLIIRKTEPLAMECVSDISSLLEKYTVQCLEIQELQQYPEFQRAVKGILEDMFLKATEVLTDRMTEFIRCHANYLDMDHEDFVSAAVAGTVSNPSIGPLNVNVSGGSGNSKTKATNSVGVNLNGVVKAEVSIPNPTGGDYSDDEGDGEGGRNDNESETSGVGSNDKDNDNDAADGDCDTQLKMNCDTAKNWIRTYMSIYLKSLKHEFRMSMAHYMVYYLRDKLYPELTSQLYNSKDIPLLIEDSVVTNDRENNKLMLERLHEAQHILHETRRF